MLLAAGLRPVTFVEAEGVLGSGGAPMTAPVSDRSRDGAMPDEPEPRNLSSWHLKVDDWDTCRATVGDR